MVLILVEVSCDLFRWKYQCKWLIVPHSYSLQPQSHYHATYYSESICESGLSVHNSHRLKAQSYLHATYLSQSICKSGLSVHSKNGRVTVEADSSSIQQVSGYNTSCMGLAIF